AAALALPAAGGVAFAGRAAWRFDRLRAVDASGRATPVAIPPQWTVKATGAPPAALAVEPDAATLSVDVPPNPDGFSARYVASGAPDTVPPVPALATPQLLARAGAKVGDELLAAGGDEREFRARIVGTVAAVPSTVDGPAMLVDLPTLDVQRLLAGSPFDRPTEWWLATDAAHHDKVAALLATRTEFTLVDRAAVARRLLADPLGRGVLVALYAAVLSATALAALGIAVDARAASLRSAGELAVLHTLGAPPRTLAGAL